MSTKTPAASPTDAPAARSPASVEIGLAVVACGAVPACWNLTLLGGLHHSPAFLVVYFALTTVLPFGVGYGVMTVSPAGGPGRVVVLAACAGAIEAFLELSVIPHITVHDMHLVAASEDYVAWIAVFCTFTAGGLYRLRTAARAFRVSRPGTGDGVDTNGLRMATQFLNFVGAAVSLYVTFKKI